MALMAMLHPTPVARIGRPQSFSSIQNQKSSMSGIDVNEILVGAESSTE